MPIARFAYAGLILACATAAQAQTVPATAQEPPPQADAGTTIQANCIAEKDEFKMRGRQPVFEIALENKCEQRVKCKVFVYINSAKGPVQGRGTIVLAEKSRGAAATKSFTMKAKMPGGSSQSARECRTY